MYQPGIPAYPHRCDFASRLHQITTEVSLAEYKVFFFPHSVQGAISIFCGQASYRRGYCHFDFYHLTVMPYFIFPHFHLSTRFVESVINLNLNFDPFSRFEFSREV